MHPSDNNDFSEQNTAEQPVVPPARPREPVPSYSPPLPRQATPPTAIGGPPNHPIETPPFDEEPEDKQKWVLLAAGIFLGLLIGVLSTYFITKDNGDTNSSNQTLSSKLEKSRDANSRLRDDVEEQKDDIKDLESDLKTAKAQANKNKDGESEAQQVAQQKTLDLQSAYRLVQQQDYEEAKSKVDSDEKSSSVIQRAIADNLAAQALVAINNGDLDQANDKLTEANSYPSTSLLKDARDARDKAEDNSTADEPTADAPVSPTP